MDDWKLWNRAFLLGYFHPEILAIAAVWKDNWVLVKMVGAQGTNKMESLERVHRKFEEIGFGRKGSVGSLRVYGSLGD